MKSIDLNCDMGEGMTTDAEIMPFISSANIACGYHAGDIDTIKRTIELCQQHGVAIGAHPGFNDRENFGRVNQQLSDTELYDLISQQLLIITNCCKEAHAALHHIKPHGALYNMAAKNGHMSSMIAKAVADFDDNLIYYGLSGSSMITEASLARLVTANEVFADRTYQSDGTLTPRTEKNALIENNEQALAQVMQMITQHSVDTVQGIAIKMVPQTICLHGDGTHAVEFATTIQKHLLSHGITIKTITHEG